MASKENNIPMKKAAGFYVGMLAAILCIAAAAVYGTKFSTIAYKEPVFDSSIVTLLGVTAGVSIIMLLVNQLAAYAPVVLCLGTGISFFKYVKMIIWPVSDTIYGIEPFQHMDELITCTVLIVLALVFAEVSLYMKKTKPVKTA